MRLFQAFKHVGKERDMLKPPVHTSGSKKKLNGSAARFYLSLLLDLKNAWERLPLLSDKFLAEDRAPNESALYACRPKGKKPN